MPTRSATRLRLIRGGAAASTPGARAVTVQVPGWTIRTRSEGLAGPDQIELTIACTDLATGEATGEHMRFNFLDQADLARLAEAFQAAAKLQTTPRAVRPLPDAS